VEQVQFGDKKMMGQRIPIYRRYCRQKADPSHSHGNQQGVNDMGPGCFCLHALSVFVSALSIHNFIPGQASALVAIFVTFDDICQSLVYQGSES
jgi:hypothetical protein